jgi:hypothetical protein
MSPQTSHTSILIHHLPTITSPLYIHIYNFPKWQEQTLIFWIIIIFGLLGSDQENRVSVRRRDIFTRKRPGRVRRRGVFTRKRPGRAHQPHLPPIYTYLQFSKVTGTDIDFLNNHNFGFTRKRPREGLSVRRRGVFTRKRPGRSTASPPPYIYIFTIFQSDRNGHWFFE